MKKLIIFISLLTLLSGCEEERKTFKGTSENWEIIFTSSLFKDLSSESTGIIRYIGNDKAPDAIEYSIISGTQEVSDQDRDLSFGKVKFKSGLCGNCPLIQTTEVVEATISWNGKSEKISLVSNDE